MTRFDILLFLPAVIATLASAVMVPLAISLAGRVGAIDYADDDRKIHVRPTARFGGVPIAVGIASGILTAWFINGRAMFPAALQVGGAAAVILCIGLIDDVRGLSAKEKLVAELVAAWLLHRAGLSPSTLFIPGVGAVALGGGGLVFTVAFVVLLTNAMNLIDGVDGLAGTQGAIVTAAYALAAWSAGQMVVCAIALAVAGACLGFLRYNLTRARIFLGDGGSLLIGLSFATLALRIWTKAGTLSVATPLLIMFVPVADTAIAFFRRAVALRPPLTGDRGHIHHRLLAAGLEPIAVTGLLALATAVTSTVAVTVSIDGWPPVVTGAATLAILGTMLTVAVNAGVQQRRLRPVGEERPEPTAIVTAENVESV